MQITVFAALDSSTRVADRAGICKISGSDSGFLFRRAQAIQGEAQNGTIASGPVKEPVMPLSRNTLERQLQTANAELAAFSKSLQEKGLSEAQFKKNAIWRSLNADIRTVRRRLAAVAQTEANNAAVVQRKAEKLAAAEAE